MAAAGGLTEPTVLAATKETVFDADSTEGYVVADTQFAQTHWLDREPIPVEIRSQLSPFNHVRVGSGYPDLVGVGNPPAELLAVDRLGDEPPLIAVEAKGYSQGGVDIERAILQAYDRLHEANLAYAAGPVDAITATDRTLARELNVGILAVDPAGETRVLEQPRVVGNRTADEAAALRFQASAQGVAEKSFGLNHPKNYLGAALAVAHDAPTAEVIGEYVVGAVDDALRGAVFLGLLDDRPTYSLTTLGEELLRFAYRNHDSLGAALEQFKDWQRSRKRFIEIAPLWGEVTRRIVFAYPVTELLVTELQQMHDDGLEAPTLVELVEWLHTHHPALTVELFVRGTEGVRERVLTEDGTLRPEALEEGGVYHSPTVFQLKAMLYHTDVLAERGAEPSNLDPTTDSWRLRQPLDRWRSV